MKKFLVIITLSILKYNNLFAQCEFVPFGNDESNQPYISGHYTSNTIIDTNGYFYVGLNASYDDIFFLKRYNNFKWDIYGDSISISSSDYIKLSIDADNNIYILYKDLNNNDRLAVKKFNGNSWSDIGNGGISNGSPNNDYVIEFDSSNTPYIAYTDDSTNYKASVKKFDGTNWISVGPAILTDSVAGYLYLKFDNMNTPYIGYVDHSLGKKQTVKKFDGNNWTTVGNAGFGNQSYEFCFDVSDSNNLFVAYADASLSNKATVMKFDGINWVVVGSYGFTSGPIDRFDLEIDSNNHPYIAFRDAMNNGRTSVMKYNGTNWQYVGNPEIGPQTHNFCNLIIDNNGLINVFIGGTSSPVLAKYDNITWNFVNDSPFLLAGTGILDVAITKDKNNNLWIVYPDIYYFGNITVKMHNGIEWVTIGSPGFSTNYNITYASIAIDTNLTPYVIYSGGTGGGNARVMKYNGSTWSNVGLASGNVSSTQAIYPSIKINKNNVVFVSFQETDRSIVVKKLSLSGTSWSTVSSTSLSSTNNYFPSMNIDTNNMIYLTYADENWNLKVKKSNGVSAWADVSTDSIHVFNYGWIESFMDNNGTPYISYIDFNTGDWVLKKLVGANWSLVGTFESDSITYGNLVGKVAFNNSNTPYLTMSNPFNGYPYHEIKPYRLNNGLWERYGQSKVTEGIYRKSNTIFFDNKILLLYSGDMSTYAHIYEDIVDVTTTVYDTTIFANATGVNYQWLDCDNNYSIILGETNQSYTPTSTGNYAVEITNSTCVDTSVCVNFISVGTTIFDINNSKIYPNPTKDILNITFKELKEIANYSIISLDGRIINQKNNLFTNKIIIDLSNESNGIYFLKINEKDSTTVFKIIKQ
ncbi:MAG: T9SS type A sorting domain-containing protein [Flavobacteriales bacterium]